ncbi:MAG: GAF domain-containing protein, partial [Chloroflexi bacterium]|nr:GAF domain-containing protein [Chloroflexota bacterium]
MSQPDERDRRIQDLEERLTRLSEASLRINESLDFDTVLQQVLDSSRDLTGARYGVIAIRDEQGDLETVLTSGTSEEEHQQVTTLPGGDEIFAHFIALPDPVRVDHWGVYAESAELNGFLPMPVWAGLTAPIRYHGQ